MNKTRQPKGFHVSSDGLNRLKARKFDKGYSYEKISQEAYVTIDQVKRLFNPDWGYNVGKEAIEFIARVLDLHPRDIVGSQWDSPNNDNQMIVSSNLPFNPFGDRGKITDESRFFDRDLLFHEIWEVLGKGGNVSLVGDTQVGKSSILSMICQKGLERLQIPVIYLDMQIIHNENQFFEELCHILGVEPCCRGTELKQALGKKRYILCLDEIEKMTRKEHFTGNERTELRGLADGDDTPLTLVIASRSRLDHLFPDSPLITPLT